MQAPAPALPLGAARLVLTLHLRPRCSLCKASELLEVASHVPGELRPGAGAESGKGPLMDLQGSLGYQEGHLSLMVCGFVLVVRASESCSNLQS